MHRRVRAALVAASMTVALVGIAEPARATHGCAAQECQPATVWVLEGIGFVCDAANVPNRSDERCTYRNDALWTGTIEGNTQGLTWPGLGPPADGPFSFNAGPSTTTPTSACVSSVTGPGCSFRSHGFLKKGDASGLGAYCGASQADAFTTFNAPGLTVKATYVWRQSAATILPLEGSITDSTPNGMEGGSFVGMFSARGTANGGNCGITQITTAFNVEGMIVTF